MRERFLDTFSSTWQKQFFSEGVLDRIATEHLNSDADHAAKIFAILVLEQNVSAMRSFATLNTPEREKIVLP
jgi:hypothetical protein